MPPGKFVRRILQPWCGEVFIFSWKFGEAATAAAEEEEEEEKKYQKVSLTSSLAAISLRLRLVERPVQLAGAHPHPGGIRRDSKPDDSTTDPEGRGRKTGKSGTREEIRSRETNNNKRENGKNIKIFIRKDFQGLVIK
ncbi:hypothetical protein RUM44_006961 [Polyplax serrata]|uniref:Uncharacterized protein n=1 Tax=Polyplax serrata TaxID=468196 RepID=A0ABR1AZD2_POLSC